MTAIDFTAEVEKRKEELLADLFSLLEINSERDDSKSVFVRDTNRAIRGAPSGWVRHSAASRACGR